MTTSEEFLYLTTTGHQSGNPHEIEIWYVEHDGCYYLVAERRERSHWVQNIRANPAITYRLGIRHFRGKGAFPDDPQILKPVKAKMDAKYNWSDGLVVQLCGEQIT